MRSWDVLSKGPYFSYNKLGSCRMILQLSKTQYIPFSQTVLQTTLFLPRIEAEGQHILISTFLVQLGCFKKSSTSRRPDIPWWHRTSTRRTISARESYLRTKLRKFSRSRIHQILPNFANLSPGSTNRTFIPPW